MKIAVLTSGILPVPAVQGGAVENLIDYYLAYNDIHKLHDITIYSCKCHETNYHPALKSVVNHYHYVDTSSFVAKIRKRLYLKKVGGNEFHHYSIEYFIEQVLKHLRKQTYDLIIIENRPPFALKVSKVTDAKIIFHIHNDKFTNELAYAEEICKAASLIINVSDYVTNAMKHIESANKKCITIHNGIDIDAFSRSKINNITRESVGLKKEDFVLVFSGRLTREKGISELIDAIILLEKYNNIKLLVIGSSFYGNTNNENQFIYSLKEKAETVKGKILFTGFVPYKQIPDYLYISDVAVIPSNWEDPFPTTVLEAQAMGLPIISTKRGGIPEEVVKENAILLETDEHFTHNLADSIFYLYQHPDKLRSMSKASLQRSKLFSKETYARQFFAALEKIK